MKRTPLRKRNPERKARLTEEQFGPLARRKWIKMQPCVIPGCGAWPCENVHVTSRGAGGTPEDIVPMCAEHHRKLHGLNSGIETFQAEHGVDLRALAEWTQTRWILYQGKRQ